MSDLKQDIVFPSSGLDTDTSYQFMQLGDAPYRMHISQGEDGINGLITNMKGNHVATYHDLTLSNAYQVVGSYYNSLTRKVYYWIFSQPYDSDASGTYLYDNKLLEFDEDTEVISLIFLDTKNYFGLDLAHPVKDCDMIGDYLYFNPRVSEPKMIDVVRAKNYTDYNAWDEALEYSSGDKVRFFGGVFVANTAVNAGESPATHPAKWDRIGDSYQNETDLTDAWDSEFRYAFNVLRQIPAYRPVCAYGTDTNKHANNVRGKLFKFAYRFRYYDDTHSRFSAHSSPTLPQYDEYYNGEVPEELDVYNFINVNIRLHSASLIKEIEIAFQEIGGDWKLAKIINRWEQALLDDIVYTYKFYNTDPWYTVLPEALFEVQDSVPRWASTQELINKNILTYGGVTEGFDNVDKDEIDVLLTPEMEAIAVPATVQTIRRDCVESGDVTSVWSEDREQYETWVNFSDWFPSGVTAGDILRTIINGVEKTYTIQIGDTADIATFMTAIAGFLDTNYPVMGTGSWTDSDIYSFGAVVTITKFIFYETGTDEVALTKFSGFKTGAWHPFCIFYYDRAMRRSDAQVSKDLVEGVNYAIDGTNVYIPLLGEVSPPPLTTAYRWIVNWEINHLPPTWAKWWRWGYAGNSLCSWFVQYTASAVTAVAPWVTIDITPLQTLKDPTDASWNEFPQSIIKPYQWQAGDRVRIHTEASSATDLGAILEGVYDFEIVKHDDTTNIIYVQNFAIGTIGEDSLIEIYRPRKDDTEPLFFEFGDIMPIIEDSDGNLVHGVSGIGTQDQDYALTLPATGVFNAGDVYHILRTPSKPIDTTEGYFMESLWYSDFYKSDAWDSGRAGVESNFGERTLNIVRFSHQLLQNTRINGLSTFDADDYKELNDIYGDIVGMMEVGNTLKVYMEKKSASILVGRQEYVDTAGQSTIATSTSVLGSVRYPENNFGTQWIESLTKNNRYVYGFDVYNAVVWRDSANGLFPISGRFDDPVGGSGNYRMSTWFKEKADALMLSGIENTQVITTWDERYKNLYVIFKDYADSDNDAVVVFHEPSNRWITFAEFWYTPSEGWNRMIELTYEVVKGFDLGIGFEWDEDTRFAIFDIETSNKTDLGITTGSITLTPYDPTIAVDEALTTGYGDLVITAYDPTVGADSPEGVVLGDIVAIADGDTNSSMSVSMAYDNAGGSDTIAIDWRILDEDNVQVNSGTQDVTFLGFVAGQIASLTSMYYPETSGALFHLQIKKGSDAWTTSVSIDFNTL